jgi:hypothetical protein
MPNVQRSDGELLCLRKRPASGSFATLFSRRTGWRKEQEKAVARRSRIDADGEFFFSLQHRVNLQSCNSNKNLTAKNAKNTETRPYGFSLRSLRSLWLIPLWLRLAALRLLRLFAAD